ncbi:MAG TPA: sugar ABC transporter ATP-binding protein [Mycobacteriales bacterium]|nr:sugar ABC transporter ATP-binding protein [Mycobacteriales bacterium]
MPAEPEAAGLAAVDVRKQYGGVRALAGASLALAPGEVHALVGENGAGKSTLVKVLAGVVQPDGGRLERAGAPVRFTGPLDAQRQGVSIVSQELSLFPDLDVLGNLFPHHQPRRYGLLDTAAMARRAGPLLAELGLDDVPLRAPLDGLTLAQQQLVEICRALLHDPAVVILDEPTSALPPAAVRRLTAVIRQITGRGVAVLYVTHFLAEAVGLADRITVLRDGRNVMTGTPAADVTIPTLVTAMLGDSPLASHVLSPADTAAGRGPGRAGAPDGRRPAAGSAEAAAAGGTRPGRAGAPDSRRPATGSGEAAAAGGRGPGRAGDRRRPAAGSGEVAAAAGRGPGRASAGPDPAAGDLRLTGVTVPGELDAVSLVARPGEVLGLAGLAGAGHTAILDLLWGRLRPTAGTIRLPDGTGRPASMAAAVRHGVAYLPSDRKRLGLMLDASVGQNITTVSWLADRRGGTLLRPARMRAAAARRIAELRIRGSADDPVSALSGGNQQKVVFAKWLHADPSLVLLDDPTRGVDVAAKAEMHAIIRRLAAEGRTVLICSTDLAELATVCDRVIILHRGRITAEHHAPALSEPTLLHAINTPTPN